MGRPFQKFILARLDNLELDIDQRQPKLPKHPQPNPSHSAATKRHAALPDRSRMRGPKGGHR